MKVYRTSEAPSHSHAVEQPYNSRVDSEPCKNQARGMPVNCLPRNTIIYKLVDNSILYACLGCWGLIVERTAAGCQWRVHAVTYRVVEW